MVCWAILFKELKSTRSRRTVELPEGLVAVLHKHMAAIRAVPHPDRLVLVDAKGGPLRRSSVLRREWYPLLERAGFGKERFGFHALRHTHGSHLCARGADVAAVSARLGHADAAFTYKTYVHPLATEKQRARSARAPGWTVPSAPRSAAADQDGDR